jgi:hypothetical protein
MDRLLVCYLLLLLLLLFIIIQTVRKALTMVSFSTRSNKVFSIGGGSVAAPARISSGGSSAVATTCV